MPATFWPTRSKTSCPATPFARGSGAARRLLISSLILLGGCRGTDVVARSAYEPNVPAPGPEEFDRSAKILFKQCTIAFGEDRWDGVIADARRLQMTGKKWGDQKPNDAEHRSAAERLQAGAKRLEEAAAKGDATAAAKALGEVAEALTKLRVKDPPHPAEPAKKD